MEESQKSSTIIVEKCKVIPSYSSSVDSTMPHSDHLTLTFFDLIWLRFPQMDCLYFYDISAPLSFFYSDLIPNLKHSLSVALCHYSPFSGSIVWPNSSAKPFVSCQASDGVSFTVAEHSCRDEFFRISGSGDRAFVEAEALHPLVPRLDRSTERAAVFAVQVTLFPVAGISIGISAHHAVVDGKTALMFMRAWAHISRSLGGGEGLTIPPELDPSYDQTFIKDTGNLAGIFAERLLNCSGGGNNRSLMPSQSNRVLPGLVRATFQLTRADIAKLRQFVKNQHHDDNQKHSLSSFCLAYAYTLVCAVKAEGILSGGGGGKILPILVYDCRARLDPPVPENYFGNCIGGRPIPLQDPKSLLEIDGLSRAARAISEAVKSLDNGILDGAEGWVPAAGDSSPEEEEIRKYIVTGSNGLDFYGFEFDWGRPKKVDIVSIDFLRTFGMSRARDGDGGIEIALVLKKHQMEAFTSLFAQGLQ